MASIQNIRQEHQSLLAEPRCYERTTHVYMGKSGISVRLSKPLRVTSGSATMSSYYLADAWVYLQDEAGKGVGVFHQHPRGKNKKVDATITLTKGKKFPITVASYRIYSWWNSATLHAISFTCATGPSSHAMTATCLASYPSTTTIRVFACIWCTGMRVYGVRDIPVFVVYKKELGLGFEVSVSSKINYG